MRPNNQKRMRGRGRNNAGNGGGNNKGPNPLQRSYESNGPDVKVRGNAAHVSERYQQLARDAQSSGDPILAESYLQHAEHYFRLVSEYQASIGQTYTQQNDEDDEGEFENNPSGAAPPPIEGSDVQPRFQPRQPNYDENGEPIPQPPRQERQWNDRPQNGDPQQRFGRDRFRDPNRQQGGQDRHPQDRNNQDRYGQDGQPPRDGYRNDRPPRFQQDGQPRYQNDAQPPRDGYRQERYSQDGPRDGYRNDRPPRGDRFPRDGQRYDNGEPRADRSFDPQAQPQPQVPGLPSAPREGEETSDRQGFVPRRERFRDRRFGATREYGPNGERLNRDEPSGNEAPREAAEEAALSALPSFITAPVLAAPAAPVEVPPVPAVEEAPKPRRKRAVKKVDGETTDAGAE